MSEIVKQGTRRYYTTREISTLIGVPISRIWRWHSEGLTVGHSILGEGRSYTEQDLIKMRLVKRFISHGMKMRECALIFDQRVDFTALDESLRDTLAKSAQVVGGVVGEVGGLEREALISVLVRVFLDELMAASA